MLWKPLWFGACCLCRNRKRGKLIIAVNYLKCAKFNKDLEHPITYKILMWNSAMLVMLVSLAVAGVSAVEKQIRLEDIERDNLNSAKQRQQPSQQAAPQSQPTYTFLSREQQQQLEQAYAALPREQLVYQQPQSQPQQLQQQQQVSTEYLAYLQQQQQQQQQQQHQQQPQQQQQALFVPQGHSAGLSYLAVPQQSFLQPQIQQQIQQHLQQQLQHFQLQPQQQHQQVAARPAQYQLPVGSVVYSQPELLTSKQVASFTIPQQQPRRQQPTQQIDQQLLYQQLAQQYQQQQQQLQQQPQHVEQSVQYNPYNALLQQQAPQSAKTLYASGVKSTPAPATKPVPSGGFVPSSTITSSTFQHPNQGVSYSHYRRGRGGF